MYKDVNSKKGFIVVYTLLIGVLSISISLYCFKFLIKEKQQQRSISAYILRYEPYQEYKEFLFTELNGCFEKSFANPKKEDVIEYFSKPQNSLKLYYKKAYITYDTNKNNFVFAYYVDDYNYKEEFYGFSIEDSKLKLKLLESLYVEGKFKEI